MRIEKLLLNEVSTISSKESKNIVGIRKILVQSPDNCCWIIEDKRLMGCITIGDFKRYLRDGNLLINNNPQFIRDNENKLEQLALLTLHNSKIMIVPVLSEVGEIVCFYKIIEEESVIKERILRLAAIRREGNSIIAEYLHSKGYQNIFICGGNEISLELYEEFYHSDLFTSICIFECNKVNRKIDDRKYHSYINYCESYEDIVDQSSNNTIVIFSDDKSYISSQSLLEIGIQIEKLYEDIEIYIKNRKINRVILQLQKKQVKCVCVSIPNKELFGTFINWDDCNPITKLTEDEINLLFNEIGDKEYYQQFMYDFSNLPRLKKQPTFHKPYYKSKYINFLQDGERFTVNQPCEFNNTVWLIGSCIAVSVLAEDKYTISSEIQRIINFSGEKYCVKAYGVGVYIWEDIDDKINLLDIKSGDLVILMDNIQKMPSSSLDLTNDFREFYKKEGRFFFDAPIHCNYKGYQFTAKTIYDKIISQYISDSKKTYFPLHDDNIVLKNETESVKKKVKLYAENPELLSYIKTLSVYKNVNNSLCGAVVMNCNPFTKGHLHLIEYAASCVDNLYVFIVEEDKSQFLFKDRIQLVKLGTNHLNNVIILPSGKFIISSITFQDYFNKEENKDALVDTCTDVEIFGQYIVPALNIKTRFVGMEPLDPITNTYNHSMKNILPQYGCEVHVIPRIESEGNCISASRVRKLLETKNWEEIKKIVPKTTFDFLFQLY